MFYIHEILVDKSNEFYGFRFVDHRNIVLDINKKIACQIFSLPSYSVKKIKSKIEAGEIKNAVYSFSGVDAFILDLRTCKEIKIIPYDTPLEGNYITIHSTSNFSFTIHYPINDIFLKDVVASTLISVDDFIRARIASAFNIKNIFLSGINKSALITYGIIPREEEELKDIYEGCLALSKKYGFKVYSGTIPLTRHMSYDAIFLDFYGDFEFDDVKRDNYLTNGNCLFLEQTNGFFYNTGNLIDEIVLFKTPEPTEAKYFDRDSYRPINRIISVNDILYLITGSITVRNINNISCVKKTLDSLSVLNEVKTEDIKEHCQMSYRNIMMTFRVRVDYSEIGAELEDIQKAIYDEIMDAEWDGCEVINTAVEFLENEVWIYAVLREEV